MIIFLSRHHWEYLGICPQLFDNRIDMIILDSVTKKFGAFTAVDNVSYTIQKGESFALLDPDQQRRHRPGALPAGSRHQA